MNFAVPADHWLKIKENENIHKYLDLAGEKKTTKSKKTIEHEGNGDTGYNWYVRNDSQSLGNSDRKARYNSSIREHRNYSILKIGQNTEKSPGDLRRLAVTQTPLKDRQQVLVWIARLIIIMIKMRRNIWKEIDDYSSIYLTYSQFLFSESYSCKSQKLLLIVGDLLLKSFCFAAFFFCLPRYLIKTSHQGHLWRFPKSIGCWALKRLCCLIATYI